MESIRQTPESTALLPGLTMTSDLLDTRYGRP